MRSKNLNICQPISTAMSQCNMREMVP